MNKATRILFLITAFFASISCFAQIGINTTTPLSTLDINGNLSVKEIGIINANVTGSAPFIGGSSNNAKIISDGVYISLSPVASSGVNGPEFILPNAADVPGRIYILRNISPTIDAALYSYGGKFFPKDSKDATCPNCPGNTTSFIRMPYNSSLKTIIVISDGSNWTYFF